MVTDWGQSKSMKAKELQAVDEAQIKARLSIQL